MSQESEIDKSCTEVFSITNDKTQNDVSKSGNTGNKVTGDADSVSNKTTKIDVAQDAIRNSPTEKKMGRERRSKTEAILTSCQPVSSQSQWSRAQWCQTILTKMSNP